MADSEPPIGTMPGSSECIHLSQKTTLLGTEKVIPIVGIYGIPGCGKTYLLNQLKQNLGETHFAFFEGSEVISSLVPGGLEEFRKSTEQEKMLWRQRAISYIRKTCTTAKKLGVVTGHFMFWPEQESAGQTVYTCQDLHVYTHILYLNVPLELIGQRCQDDVTRNRPYTSIDHLRKWQDAEQTQLRLLCRDHSILFCLLSAKPTLVDKVMAFIRDFRCHSKGYNLACAETKLDEVINAEKKLQTMLAFDADKTLISARRYGRAVLGNCLGAWTQFRSVEKAVRRSPCLLLHIFSPSHANVRRSRRREGF
ncbi:hypothetical protein RRF57_009099 [Xylaria bambusicola]|uniref:Uncharacterized protein n=1 Tax=Xylaria bambusicola TaxID=326684 RepID=A0AAN7UJ03_9PEZI